MAYETELQIAMAMADAADQITVESFRQLGRLTVEIKSDASLVSEVDRQVEYALHRIAQQADPDTTFLGEELNLPELRATPASRPKRRWIVDPLDQTRNYLRGIEIFGTLIALEEEGDVQLGLISAPMLRCRWWAIRGQGSYQNGVPMNVSTTRSVTSSAGSLHLPKLLGRASEHHLVEGLSQVGMLTGLGNFWAHMLVARGSLDWAVSTGGKIWDYAAPMVIVREAGGIFTDFAGQSKLDSKEALSSNGALHPSLVRFFTR